MLVWRIKMSVLGAPLHMVHLYSPLVSGCVKAAVRQQLPISGVFSILGNDLPGGKGFPPSKVVGITIFATLASAPPACARCVSCLREHAHTGL